MYSVGFVKNWWYWVRPNPDGDYPLISALKIHIEPLIIIIIVALTFEWQPGSQSSNVMDEFFTWLNVVNISICHSPIILKKKGYIRGEIVLKSGCLVNLVWLLGFLFLCRLISETISATPVNIIYCGFLYSEHLQSNIQKLGF